MTHFSVLVIGDDVEGPSTFENFTSMMAIMDGNANQAAAEVQEKYGDVSVHILDGNRIWVEDIKEGDAEGVESVLNSYTKK